MRSVTFNGKIHQNRFSIFFLFHFRRWWTKLSSVVRWRSTWWNSKVSVFLLCLSLFLFLFFFFLFILRKCHHFLSNCILTFLPIFIFIWEHFFFLDIVIVYRSWRALYSLRRSVCFFLALLRMQLTVEIKKKKRFVLVKENANRREWQ